MSDNPKITIKLHKARILDPAELFDPFNPEHVRMFQERDAAMASLLKPANCGLGPGIEREIQNEEDTLP